MSIFNRAAQTIVDPYQQFMDIYSGHTQYIPATKKTDMPDPISGKWEYCYRKFRKTIDIHAVKRHVDYGTPHIVVNPINEQSELCRFGAIDVDNYDKDFIKTLKHKISSLKLPLHMCESVSGGLHGFLYVDQWIDPKLMRAVLAHYIKVLGLPEKTEIFPKQEDLENKKFGNNIKLPCLGVKEQGLINHLKICTKLVQRKEDLEKLPIDLISISPVEAFKKTLPTLSAKEIKDNIINGIEHSRGGTFDNWIVDLVAKYVGVEMSDKEILKQLLKFKHTETQYQDKYKGQKYEDYYIEKINNCRKKFKTEDPEFRRLAFITNIIFIRKTGQFYNLNLNSAYKENSINIEFRNIMPKNKNGTRPNPSDYFALHPDKIIVENYMYRPSQYNEENKIITYNGTKYLNSYQPNNIEAVEGDITPFLELLELLFPDEEIREKVLDWYCHIIQHPGDKIRYAILLFSPEQQLGKGSLFGLMRKILGATNTLEIDVSEALDKAKNFLNKQLVLIDELKSDEKYNTNKKLVNMLKRLITEEHQGSRELYSDYKEIVSTTNYVLHSNEEDALAIGKKDPRYLIIGCYAQPREDDWYTKLWDFIGRGDEPGPGIKHVLHFLKNRKIRDSFNAKGRAPVTEDSLKMSDIGEHPLLQRVKEDFDSGAEIFLPMVISTYDFRVYYEKLHKVKIRRPNDIAKALESIGGIKYGQVETFQGPVRHPTLWIIHNHENLKNISKTKMLKTFWRPTYWIDADNKVQKYIYGGEAPEFMKDGK